MEKSAEAIVTRKDRAKGRIAQNKESVGDDSMGAKHPKAEGYQLDLFHTQQEPTHPGASGEGRTQTGACEVVQTPTASDPARALTANLQYLLLQR